jgi:hypothetical protein
MVTDYPYARYPSEDVLRNVQLLHYQAATTSWPQLIAGTATAYQDLSPYADNISHNENGLTVGLVFYQELYGAAQPRIGDLIQVKLDGYPLFNGQIEDLSNYTETRGERSMGLTVRSRDSNPLWRSTSWVGNIYPAGSELGVLARDILLAIGLTLSEIRGSLTLGVSTVHGDTQLADLPAWDMLTQILQVAGQEPRVDALGKFKPISRDIVRAPDLVLTTEQLLKIGGSRNKLPVTSVILKWLDPNLSKSGQQAQVLARESITAGFFKLKQERELYWSEDRRQRAENTWMKITASVNDGLLPVGDEDYDEKSEFSGQITVTTSVWVPTLATASLAAMLYAATEPDGVVSIGGGLTVPIGRVYEAIGQVAFFLIIMSLGTGVYEIWGEPFDYVHEMNTTEAYNDSTPEWMRLEESMDSDFVMNEGHAQQIAVRELLYRSLSAISWNVEIIDHPPLEPGDILQLPDGSRLYITGFSRDLTRGAPASLAVNGFRV